MRIKTSPNAESYFVSNLGKRIRLTGFGTITDGCYTMGACFADPGPVNPPCQADNCSGAVFIPPGVFVTANTFDTCIECAGLRATDCNSNSNVVIFNGPAATASIVGKVIKTPFPGWSERCWVISYTTGIPTTSLSTYQGPYQDCPECQGGGCVDLLSTISGVDDTCDRSIGSATVTPTTGLGPFSYLWSNGQVTQSITGLSAGVYSVVFTDSLGCTGTNTITLNNLPCPKNYRITPCDASVPSFIITNPVTSPDPNPDHYTGNIFRGNVILPSSEGSTEGCYNMEPVLQQGLTGVFISVSFYSYNTCLECNPLAWKVARCDDPNVFYFTNTDLTSITGKTINGLTLQGCDDTTFPCNTLPEQCWNITTAAPGLYPVEVISYNDIVFPDCDCCKPC